MIHWLLWKTTGIPSVVVTNKHGTRRVSRVKYAKTDPVAFEYYFKEKTVEVELNSDGTTSTGGKWKPLYPTTYKHPEA